VKLLTGDTDHNRTISVAKKLQGDYKKPVIFHAYWNGQLNEKHLLSIQSCYYFNIQGRKNKKIILWVENNYSNKYSRQIRKYAEIRSFDVCDEAKRTIFENIDVNFKLPKSYWCNIYFSHSI
jgi:hypothetical protein